MKPLPRLSIVDQTAAHLREGLRAGRWRGNLPGVLRLAAECDVSKDVIRAALRRLEADGVLAPRGHGRGRAIVGAAQDGGKRALRVAILLHQPLVDASAGLQSLLLRIARDIEAAGHICVVVEKSQADLRYDVRRIARLAGATPADAWIVLGAPAPILEWFAARPEPAFALGGRRGLPLAGAGMDAVPAVREATRRLVALGHQRIVLICPGDWARPVPGPVVQTFTAELAARGIAPGEYHVPEWAHSADGFHALLTSLFRFTPPTALLLQDPAHYVATLGFLSQRKLRVPQDVSLVCFELAPSLAWLRPPPAHFDKNDELLVRRIVRWVSAVAHGRVDRKSVSFPAEFDPGGSIAAPARAQ